MAHRDGVVGVASSTLDGASGWFVVVAGRTLDGASGTLHCRWCKNKGGGSQGESACEVLARKREFASARRRPGGF